MVEYKRIYAEAFGYDVDDRTTNIPSEISGEPSVDIHHIVTREDRIENLMALTRIEHMDYGEIKKYMYYLLMIHMRVLQIKKIPFDQSWFDKYLKQYKPFAEE